jgi:hypothetical protein
MTRPTLKAAIEWIALNDETAERADEEAVASFISTMLVADVFNTTPELIAARVIKLRREWDRLEQEGC